ncbi:hypothetical protein MSSIT_1438 [Methanosarcina siciliae T4/M]|uniref:Uncharacterized protein n=2 Tax=Methanosarcina siciliae TaxID=38027 RepID=A0A0E3LAI7_9EURY|nr:hypothetical protein MSSIT_1438 [Methanosarcina siciliae T4/M]AKB32091.1 hypothetical protein MSSIH_1401 [Methanosarcina siciliae HI350]
MRELVKPLAQGGTAVPLFALTRKGKELIIERAKDVTSPTRFFYWVIALKK